MYFPINNKHLVLVFVILLLTMNATAQYGEKDFVRYSVKNSLSDNYVTSIQQDDWGYIWVGTDVGLNRYDGNSFSNFYQGSVSLPLASNGLNTLKNFGNHQLGIISAGGFQMLNTKDLSLRNYFIPDSTAFNIYRNKAWDVARLADGSFIITTATGFYVFDTTGKLTARKDMRELKDVGKKTIHFGREIFSLPANEYLIYSEEGGLNYFNGTKRNFEKLDISNNAWNNFFAPVNSEGKGHWITKKQISASEFVFVCYENDSIIYYDFIRKKRVISPLPFRSGVEFNWTSKITMLSNSTFGINGGASGFYLFDIDRETGKVNCRPEKLLSAYKVNCLFLDKEKRLWLGTSKGLLQQKMKQPFASNYRYDPETNDRSTEGFSTIIRHRDKIYLFRYSRYSSLYIIDTATMKLLKTVNFYGNDNQWNQVFSVQMYHPDTLWLGTNAGLLWFDTKSERYGKIRINGEITYFTDANFGPARPDGYAWICSYLGGAALRYHIPTRSFTMFSAATDPALPFTEVKSVAYDSYGDVWLGGHSLARWNNRIQQFDTLMTVYAGLNKFNENILALQADNNGSLWLHNAFNGLLEYRIKEKRFLTYTMKDGLPSDALQCFSPIINNELWIGSNSNLSRFDTRTKKVTIYGQEDGLTDSKPSSRLIYFDSAAGYLYMLCQDYLVKFPSAGPKDTVSNSTFVVQQLVVNNNRSFFNTGDKIHLKYNQNDLSLHFSMIDFEEGNKYRFAYKLNDGGSWTDLAEQRTLNLNGLPSGNYSVHLSATNQLGEQKLTVFKFVIAPPFWKTAWFIAACILAFAGTLYLLYRWRISQVRQKANIDKLLAQTEMKALHAQMNPHFIFNSLNSIREMILNDENKDASHFLSKFAHLIRVTLDQSGHAFVSLRNTVDYLKRYIEMERIRNSNFKCSIVSDDQLDPDETLLPPMLIQPFIENAIWHGSIGSGQDMHIQVNFKKQDEQLLCTIDDNGIGIDQSLQNKKKDDNYHRSVGISNIRNRIRLLNEKYELECSIKIEDKSRINGHGRTGTLVTIQLPLEINANEQN